MSKIIVDNHISSSCSGQTTTTKQDKDSEKSQPLNFYEFIKQIGLDVHIKNLYKIKLDEKTLLQLCSIEYETKELQEQNNFLREILKEYLQYKDEFLTEEKHKSVSSSLLFYGNQQQEQQKESEKNKQIQGVNFATDIANSSELQHALQQSSLHHTQPNFNLIHENNLQQQYQSFFYKSQVAHQIQHLVNNNNNNNNLIYKTVCQNKNREVAVCSIKAGKLWCIVQRQQKTFLAGLQLAIHKQSLDHNVPISDIQVLRAWSNVANNIHIGKCLILRKNGLKWNGRTSVLKLVYGNCSNDQLVEEMESIFKKKNRNVVRIL